MMLITNAINVVSNAVANPLVTLFNDAFNTSTSAEPSRLPANPATAAPMPMTVPMNPIIGIAQIKTFSSA